MKMERGQLAGIALCVVVVIQTVQVLRLSHLHSDARWRLDNMQLCRALVEVQDSSTRQRVSDVQLTYRPHARLGTGRDDLMLVTPRHDNTLLAVWVGCGLPVKASASSAAGTSAEFELQPGIANLVLLVNTNKPAVGDL
jgi:hypothetical protein